MPFIPDEAQRRSGTAQGSELPAVSAQRISRLAVMAVSNEKAARIAPDGLRFRKMLLA
jgi:hypothetical protein